MESKEERQKRLRQERNQRFRDKKKTASPIQASVTLQNHSPVLSRIEDSKSSLNLLVIISLSVSITVLLCYFQAHTYIEDGMSKPLSWAISIVCETSLCYLSTTLKASRMSQLLWSSIFSYSLATMSYGLFKDEAFKKAVVTKEDASHEKDEIRLETLRETFDSTRQAFSLSIEKGQIRNAQNLIKSMEDLSEKMTEKRENMPQIETAKANELLRYEAYGLIVLRAILMILNAVLIHRIFSSKIKTFTLQNP